MKITELFFICISLVLVSFFANAKPLFLGDSLTYELAMSYKKNHPVDAKFLESTGLNSSQILDWQDYLQHIPISRYDTVYIVLGTNDLIQGSEIELYQGKAERFIKAIKRQNNNVVWLLPPALKSTEKNILLKNTRRAILKFSEEFIILKGENPIKCEKALYFTDSFFMDKLLLVSTKLTQRVMKMNNKQSVKAVIGVDGLKYPDKVEMLSLGELESDRIKALNSSQHSPF